MKRVILFLIIGGLAACSSEPVAEHVAAPVPRRTEVWDSKADSNSMKPTVSKEAMSEKRDNWSELREAIRSQNDDKILSASQQILWQSPDDEKALNASAVIYYKQGRFDLAVYLLERAIAKHPKKSELYSNMGLIETARGRKYEAIQAYRKALELNPNDSVAAANLGALYLEMRDYTKALFALEISYKQRFRDIRVLNNYGVALMATGRLEEALGVYDEGLKEQSSSREILLNKAILLVEHMGKYKEGLDVINRLKFVGPSSESRERLSRLENRAQSGVR